MNGHPSLGKKETSTPPAALSRPALLEELRRKVAAVGRGPACPSLPSGFAALDQALGGGLPRPSLHLLTEEGNPQGTPLATLWAAALLAAAPPPRLWLSSEEDLFPPGLTAAGCNPASLIFLRLPQSHLPAVAEEVLREASGGGVVIELTTPLSFLASRRLQLANERGGGLGFLLLRSSRPIGPLALRWRWHLTPLPAPPAPLPGLLPPRRWRADLHPPPGRAPLAFHVVCDDLLHPLTVAPLLPDRSLPPLPSRHAS